MRFGFIIASVILLLDQLSKYWIVHVYNLPEKGSVAILPFFSLTMVWNKGTSFGWFQANAEIWRWALVALTLAVSIGVAVYLMRSKERLNQLALGLILGGALGNIIDRVRYGAVADFLHFYAWDYSFYVFNLADSAITIGVAFLILEAMMPAGKKTVRDESGSR